MKKILKISGITLLIILIIANIWVVLSGNTHIYKALASTYFIGQTGPGIDDYTMFPYNKVKAAQDPEPWKISKEYGKAKLSPDLFKKIEQYDPAAFLVVHNDSILYEHYWDGYSDTSRSNSFSMAKTLTAMNVAKAVQEGKINSLDDKVIKYLPNLKGKYADEVTIKNLLQMTSGIDFDENYSNPFGFMAKVYYGNKIKEKTLKYEALSKPDKIWKYSGGNTLLLSFIVEKVTGESMSEYFSKNIWQPVGAETDAYWTIGKQGREKAYCCFNSNVRDFARLGQLLIDSGRWNGKQVLPLWFCRDGLQTVEGVKNKKGEKVDYYGYQIWMTDYKGRKAFYLRGILGQYVICVPEENLVIVRLGNTRSKQYIKHHPTDVSDDLEAGFQLIKSY